MRALPKITTLLAACAVAVTGGVASETAAPAPAEAATTASTASTAKVTASWTARMDAWDLAKSRVGKTPYKYGGTSLWKGVDCSGFVLAVYKKQGVKLPRTAKQQKSAVRPIHRKWLRAGDLVFYGTHHVAIYVGNGYIVDAPSSGRKVSKRKMWSGSRTYGTLRPA